MGKAGKQRKKRKLLGAVENLGGSTVSKSNVVVSSHFDDDSCSDVDEVIPGISASDLSASVRVLSTLANNPSHFKDPALKTFRATLHRLQHSEALANAGKSCSGAVSDALRDGRWDDAIRTLDTMRTRGEVPKLGALQRWVRDCDAAGINDYHALVVLDRVLRTVDPSMVPAGAVNAGQDVIRWRSPWEGTALRESFPASPAVDVSRFKVAAVIPAADRNPPNRHPLTIHMSVPGQIVFAPSPPATTRIDVPSVPGAFFLKDVFTPEECAQIVATAETKGFEPDEPLTGGSNSILAHNFVWLVDEDIETTMYSRCQHLLAQNIAGGDVAGINTRWRVYRYKPGSVYRPHIDGAWPGSKYQDGKYLYDGYGDRWSRFTFLIYLNEGFSGGCTTFFTPAADVGHMEAWPVLPRVGCVLVFPHGDTQGSLLHEGSGVVEGTKYVVRTEVLYMKGRQQPAA